MVAEGTAKTTPQKRWAGTLLSVRGVAWHYMYAREACSQEKMNSGAPIDSGAGCPAGKRAQLQYPRTPSVIQTGRLLAAGNRQRRHTSSSAQSAELTRPRRCCVAGGCSRAASHASWHAYMYRGTSQRARPAAAAPLALHFHVQMYSNRCTNS
jgi:hypothetical protein